MSDERVTSERPAVGHPACRPTTDANWYVLIQGKDIGPFTVKELTAQAIAGVLGANNLVRQGDGAWVPARSIERLAMHLRGAGAETGVQGGIGGWLILPALGLILSPFVDALAISRNFEAIDSGAALDPLVRNVLVAEILLTLCVLLFQVYVAVAFFRRKRAACDLMVMLFLVSVVVNLSEFVMVASVTEQPPKSTDVIRLMVMACIWIPYFTLSRQVKATFIY
jgi:hypothetical protein